MDAKITNRKWTKEWCNKVLTNKGNVALFILGLMFLVVDPALAIDLPGDDLSGEFKTASSLLKTTDTIVFGWLRPLIGAVFLFLSTYSLIQQKLFMFFICLAAAVILLVVPKFIKDLKNLGGGSVFSQVIDSPPRNMDLIKVRSNYV